MSLLISSLVMLTMLFAPVTAHALGWHLQYTEANRRTLYGVKFVDSLNGWVVGDSGVILHTANGGTNWNYQTSGTLRALRGVSFTDRNYGCAVGDSGKILHTNNGGVLWSVQTSGTTRVLRSVSFTDSMHGCVVGDSGTILHTNNGGTTWSRQTSGTPYALNSVCFVDSSHGWAVGGYYVYPDTINTHSVIVHTNDGGATWNSQNAGTNLPINDVTFIDSSRGWVVGGYFSITGNERISRSAIFYTINSGYSWIRINNLVNGNLSSIVMFDSINGWLAYTGIASMLALTHDGGSNWYGGFFFDHVIHHISFTDTTHGWIVGDSGKVSNYDGFTGIENESKGQLPKQICLQQNYPNPFNSSTTISYSIPKFNPIRLELFDLLGRNMSTLVNTSQNAGTYRVQFDGKQLPSGVYFVRLQTGSYTQSRKILLLK